ncbi:MAG: hypothetical protein IPN72_09210 [Saprospiraceae bacterium]|nr:hypothetical protein [Saprospiraceae bacterium]
MAHYKANSTNSQNFELSIDGKKIGELIYKKWYSFQAEIQMINGRHYALEPKGFWDSKIELIDGSNTILDFKMGWKGIIIRTFFNNKEETYLLSLKGILRTKFILFDTDKRELMAAETDFKWNKLNYDYDIETSSDFEKLVNKELLLLTILHCINYYITIVSAA